MPGLDNLDPGTVGWLLSVLGGATAPNKPTVQKLSQGGVDMARGLQAAKIYKDQRRQQQEFAQLLKQLLAGGVTAKGTPGLDAISAGEDGSLTIKVPPMEGVMDGWMQGDKSLTGTQGRQTQPGFLASLFEL
jgi:hypothetical protein